MYTLMRAGLLAVAAGLLGCDSPGEAPRVQLPVVVDASGLAPFTTDLDYTIELTSARVAIGDLVFTVAGETHARRWPLGLDLVVGTAHAHPGHGQGGAVTGELPGAFVVDWATEAGRTLGTATLIAGGYRAANFTFGRGQAAALGVDDPLVGHTAWISGTASRAGESLSFTVVVDSPEGRVLVGVPFEATVGANTSGRLGVRFNPVDAVEGDTLFDGIDFTALDHDADGAVAIEPAVDEVEAAYQAVRRAFQTHDHYSVELQ